MIRHRGYYLFRCSFCAATIWGWRFFGNPGDIDGWIKYVRVRRWRLLDSVSGTRSLSVLLSAVGKTCTTQTVLALAWWLSSKIIRTCVCMLRLLAVATIEGRHLFHSKASDCAATSWGRPLFEGGVYSKKYGTSKATGTRSRSLIKHATKRDGCSCHNSWDSRLVRPGDEITVAVTTCTRMF